MNSGERWLTRRERRGRRLCLWLANLGATLAFGLMIAASHGTVSESTGFWAMVSLPVTCCLYIASFTIGIRD